MFKNKLYQLQYKYPRFGISNLMMYIAASQAIVYFADIFLPDLNLISLLSLNMHMVMRGEIWRLVSFIVVPPNTSILFVFISLYFYYLLGSALENEWGTFIFNVYYLIGVAGCILTAIITGSCSNVYLNSSIFFAFAILFPNFEILIIYIIPCKIKYLAIFEAVVYLLMFVLGGWSARIAILFSLANLYLFFGNDFIKTVKQEIYHIKARQQFKNQGNYWK